MKFLVVAKVREILTSVSIQQYVRMVVAEWEDLKQLSEEGKTEVHALAGMKGVAFITEAETAAELHARVHNMPLYPVLEIEIYPLVSIDDTLAHAKGWAEAVSATLAQSSH